MCPHEKFSTPMQCLQSMSRTSLNCSGERYHIPEESIPSTQRRVCPLSIEFLSQRRVHVPFISRARQSGCMNKVSEEHKRLYSQLPSSLKPGLLMHMCSYAHHLSTHAYSACQQEVLLYSSYKKFLQTCRYAPSCVNVHPKMWICCCVQLTELLHGQILYRHVLPSQLRLIIRISLSSSPNINRDP